MTELQGLDESPDAAAVSLKMISGSSSRYACSTVSIRSGAACCVAAPPDLPTSHPRPPPRAELSAPTSRRKYSRGATHEVIHTVFAIELAVCSNTATAGRALRNSHDGDQTFTLSFTPLRYVSRLAPRVQIFGRGNADRPDVPHS